jgi:hypothetical protein
MKKKTLDFRPLAFGLISLCAMLHAPCASADALVFSNQTITVEPDQLSVESVEFQPLEIVTNNAVTWETVTQVVTNGMFDGYSVETNEVQRQIITPAVTTNEATWTVNVIFSLPKGHLWSLNGMPVTIDRFRTAIAVPVDPSAVIATLGAQAAAGLEFAAQNGAYTPTGQVKDAFLSLAASVLAGGAE